MSSMFWSPHDRNTYEAIASVCHQTRREALLLLLRECRSPDSIESFIDWTAKGSPHLLPYIVDFLCLWTMQSPFFPVSKVLDESLQASRPTSTAGYSNKKWSQVLLRVRRLFRGGDPLKPALKISQDPLAGKLPHVKENEALERAFSSTSNLRKLRLNVDLTERRSRADRPVNHGRYEDQETLLRIISHSCPKLAGLSCSSMDLVHLDCLQAFHNLTTLI